MKTMQHFRHPSDRYKKQLETLEPLLATSQQELAAAKEEIRQSKDEVLLIVIGCIYCRPIGFPCNVEPIWFYNIESPIFLGIN